MTDQEFSPESAETEPEAASAARVPVQRRDCFTLYAEFYAMRLEAPAV
jgi:hypothetical protein